MKKRQVTRKDGMTEVVLRHKKEKTKEERTDVTVRTIGRIGPKCRQRQSRCSSERCLNDCLLAGRQAGKQMQAGTSRYKQANRQAGRIEKILQKT